MSFFVFRGDFTPSQVELGGAYPLIFYSTDNHFCPKSPRPIRSQILISGCLFHILNSISILFFGSSLEERLKPAKVPIRLFVARYGRTCRRGLLSSVCSGLWSTIIRSSTCRCNVSSAASRADILCCSNTRLRGGFSCRARQRRMASCRQVADK